MEQLFEVVHEDHDVLVINKPAGLVCHPTKGDLYSSLISRVRLYLGPSLKPQLINRLDRETSGLILIGKHPGASLELRRLWENGQVDKHYLAIVWGHLQESSGTIDAPLGKDETSRVAIKDTVRTDGAPAQTRFELLSRFSTADGDYSLLEVRPLTGRKHQIRIHLAHMGHPIIGDKLYGGDEQFYLDFVFGKLTEHQRRALRLRNHALHAHKLDIPWRGQHLSFASNPEPEFTDFIALANLVL